jgi:hypothetical protein
MNVFFDTNVLMDVLLQRHPFVDESREVWFLAERGKVVGLVSALSFPNIYYVARKALGAETALSMMSLLRDTLTAVPLDEQILNQAMDAKFSDFEDAIQYFPQPRSLPRLRPPRAFARGIPGRTRVRVSPAGGPATVILRYIRILRLKSSSRFSRCLRCTRWLAARPAWQPSSRAAAMTSDRSQANQWNFGSGGIGLVRSKRPP